MQILLAQRGTPVWQESAALVSRLFATNFGADVFPDPDYFVAHVGPGRDGRERVQAAAGITYPDGRALLLEKYLDDPVEAVLSDRYGTTVRRSEILQLGNIASDQTVAGVDLIRSMPLVLFGMGRPYAVLTMNRQLAAVMRRLGLTYQELCPADGSRLEPEELARWGTYYQSRPVVGYGRVDEQVAPLAHSLGRFAFDAMRIRLLAPRHGELADAA